MGVAGWRFARNRKGRAAALAVLEELPVICSVMVATGSMIMIGIMLCNDWRALNEDMAMTDNVAASCNEYGVQVPCITPHSFKFLP
jgi:hypothetical protein